MPNRSASRRRTSVSAVTFFTSYSRSLISMPPGWNANSFSCMRQPIAPITLSSFEAPDQTHGHILFYAKTRFVGFTAGDGYKRLDNGFTLFRRKLRLEVHPMISTPRPYNSAPQCDDFFGASLSQELSLE